jgi:hypothetical protein
MPGLPVAYPASRIARRAANRARSQVDEVVMRRVIAVCGLVCVAAGCAQVHEPESTNPVPSTDARPPAAVSGESRPASQPAVVTAKLQVLERNLSRSSVGLRSEAIGDGVQKIDLQGRFLHATVLEHRAAGVQQHVCVDHPTAMSDMFTR